MATTRNMGQMLVEKAQEFDPTFIPDKFNDAGDALDIVLKNIGKGGSAPTEYGLEFYIGEYCDFYIEGISEYYYNEIRNKSILGEIKSIYGQECSSIKEANRWLYENWATCLEKRSQFYASMLSYWLGLSSCKVYCHYTTDENTTWIRTNDIQIMIYKDTNKNKCGNIVARAYETPDATTPTKVGDLIESTAELSPWFTFYKYTSDGLIEQLDD